MSTEPANEPIAADPPPTATNDVWVTPVSVFVVSHPECQESSDLADGLYRWLRLMGGPEAAPEAGLPVWYRRRVEGTGEAARLSPAVTFGEARLNVVVVLCGERMALDPSWWAALDALLKAGEAEASRNQGIGDAAYGQLLVLPVGVSEAISGLGFLTGDRQVIRLPRESADRAPATTAETATLRLRTLRRSVTEAVLRRMTAMVPPQGQPPEGGTTRQEGPPRARVFISHAKLDGRTIAEGIRDGLARFSQLEPWYDATDLAAGSPWIDPMTNAARSTTDGLIAVVSDAYHSRYWCQREALEARQPRRIDPNLSVWAVQPTVALVATQGGARRPVPALNGVLHLGWREVEAAPDASGAVDELTKARVKRLNDKRAADAIEDVVEWWLLEALLSRVAERRARDVLGRAKGNGLALLTFTPDPFTLGRLIGVWRSEGQRMPALICYPAFGLPRAGLERLREVLVDHGYSGDAARAALTPLEALVHDEDLWDTAALTATDAGKWSGTARRPANTVTLKAGADRIALSAGGEDSELAAAGLGEVHLADLLLRLSRALLSAGHALAFGGQIEPDDKPDNPHNLTEALMLAAQGWAAAQADVDSSRDGPPPTDGAVSPLTPEQRADRSLARLRYPPLLNLVPWQVHPSPELALRAARVGVCTFEDVSPPGVEPGVLAVLRERARTDEKRQPTATTVELHQIAIYKANALTKMRTTAAEVSAARVLVGGKIHGASGWLPGIAEELEASLWANATAAQRDSGAWQPAYAQPVLVLGGFGGMAGQIAELLRGKIEPEALWGGALQRSNELMAAIASPFVDAGYPDRREADFLDLLGKFAAHLERCKDGDAVFPAAAWSTRTITGEVFRELLREGSPSLAVRTTCQALGERRAAEPPPAAKASIRSRRDA